MITHQPWLVCFIAAAGVARNWAGDAGRRSRADAQGEIKLPKYETWPDYGAFLP
jgi:hypothetical protein